MPVRKNVTINYPQPRKYKRFDSFISSRGADAAAGRNCLVLEIDISTGETELCAFCGESHSHGIAPGHRVAHCKTQFVRNPVFAANGTPLYKSDGYYLEPVSHETAKATWPDYEKIFEP